MVKHRYIDVTDASQDLHSLAQYESLTQYEYSILGSFQISTFLVLGEPDENTGLYSTDHKLQKEHHTRLLCERCVTRNVTLGVEVNRKFRKALMALNLDAKLVKEVKEYSCVRNDGCHI